MRWLVAGLALLGGLAGGALGIYLPWIGSDLAGFLGGQTWSSHAGELFDASAVWLWRIRSIRIALLLVASIVVLAAGIRGAVLVMRRDQRAGRVLAIPVVGTVVLALPDALMMGLAHRIALVLGIAAVAACLARPPRRAGWAAAVILALAVATFLPGFVRGRVLAAVRSGEVTAARAWIAVGAGPGEIDDLPPLLVAVEARDAEMAELLVRSAADPYEVGPSGRSPMALSIAQGSTAVTERMLSTVLAMDDVRQRRGEE